MAFLKVGHWLGLHHTFEGKNCAYPNDEIQDTRPQDGPSAETKYIGEDGKRLKCKPENTRTCAKKSLVFDQDSKIVLDRGNLLAFDKSTFDAVGNAMDYQQDTCGSEFTPHQIRRMQDQWIRFRKS